MHRPPVVEVLESRIAPAAIVYSFTDVDGDTVKVTSTKGKFNDLVSAIHLTNGQLTEILSLRPI